MRLLINGKLPVNDKRSNNWSARYADAFIRTMRLDTLLYFFYIHMCSGILNMASKVCFVNTYC